jgi:4-deoxy-L-threo-5-hexosulose-uronate ketol-isomerase
MNLNLEIRNPIHPDHGKQLDTEGLRKEFLIKGLFEDGKLTLVYSHIDRIIAGGAVPKSEALALSIGKETIGADYFLERRELGVINLGGEGTVTVDGAAFPMGRLEGLYVGKGSKSVELSSSNPKSPAKFYLLSAMAHKELPTTLVCREKAKRVKAGSAAECNARTIYQVIHPDVVQSCSLVMGYTSLDEGSAWNTMPCHTHVRRMEVYLYFDLTKDTVVFHLMGEPSQTRHIVVRNEEAVICPSWSIHSGVGTRNYSFVWGMTGENQTFTDMDDVSMELLR